MGVRFRLIAFARHKSSGPHGWERWQARSGDETAADALRTVGALKTWGTRRHQPHASLGNAVRADGSDTLGGDERNEVLIGTKTRRMPSPGRDFAIIVLLDAAWPGWLSQPGRPPPSPRIPEVSAGCPSRLA